MDEIVKQYTYPQQHDQITLYQDGMILVKFGEVTPNDIENNAETKWVVECFEEMKRLRPEGHLKILLDFTTIDSGEFNTKESNQHYREMLHDPMVDKVAVFGVPVGWQLVIDLLRAFMPHKLQTFSTEAAARQWLWS